MANRKIEDVEGIGPVLGDKFRAAGVKDTDALLKSALTAAQREARFAALLAALEALA